MADPDAYLAQYATLRRMSWVERRQDDLSLDKRARGPRYAPTGRNGTDHIPHWVKQALQKGWGNPIHDEGSEQMEKASGR
jgi:hypothetical protein